MYKPVNTNASIKQVLLPPIILKTHRSEDLDIDFLYVQGAPYLFIKSTKIKFHATLAFNNISKRSSKTTRTTYKRGPKDIINGLEKVLTISRNRGFQVNLINADNKFKRIEDKRINNTDTTVITKAFQSYKAYDEVQGSNLKSDNID